MDVCLTLTSQEITAVRIALESFLIDHQKSGLPSINAGVTSALDKFPVAYAPAEAHPVTAQPPAAIIFTTKTSGEQEQPKKITRPGRTTYDSKVKSMTIIEAENEKLRCLDEYNKATLKGEARSMNGWLNKIEKLFGGNRADARNWIAAKNAVRSSAALDQGQLKL